MLTPGGRFAAIERHTKPGATGHASHGWTDDQAEAFASLCRSSGFTHVEIAHHAGRRGLVAVVATIT